MCFDLYTLKKKGDKTTPTRRKLNWKKKKKKKKKKNVSKSETRDQEDLKRRSFFLRR